MEDIFHSFASRFWMNAFYRAKTNVRRAILLDFVAVVLITLRALQLTVTEVTT